MKKLAVLPLVLACSQAMAFDDNRQGFMMNFGIGLSSVDFKFGGASETDSGIATTIKIGYGFSDSFQLYYVRDANWTNQYNETFVNGLTGIGANLYVNEKTYLTGAVGIGDISTLNNDYDSESGNAYSIGVGYEFSPHHNVQLSYLATDINDLNTSALNLLYSYSLY